MVRELRVALDGFWAPAIFEVSTVPVDLLEEFDLTFFISALLSCLKMKTCGLYHKEGFLACSGWVCSRPHRLHPHQTPLSLGHLWAPAVGP